MSVLVLCVGGGIGCTLAHHTAWQACSLPTCMQHPLLVSFAFLPPLQKQLEFWGLALLADLHCSVGVVWVLAYLSTFDAIFASCCHTLACEPHQPTCFIPCHLCRSNLNSGDWRCFPICIAGCSVGVPWVPALLPCWHHCLPHPLLVSLINVHSSFLATFASNVNCGEWRCLPVCIAASALFGLASIAAMLASWLKPSLC